MITELTRMFLVNAIYFKSLWEYKFDRDESKMEHFYVSEKKKQKVSRVFEKNVIFSFTTNQKLALRTETETLTFYISF
jgi:serine protease inhibitor